MGFFQWQKIDPSPRDIDAALIEASQASGCQRPLANDRQYALAKGKDEPAGDLFWNAERRRVTGVWWTDHIGRRHWYVEGDQYREHGTPDPLWRCGDGLAHAPLEVIAPLHTVIREEVKGATLLVVCDCGEVGAPEDLGWAGDCCGPCFDRRGEGAAQPGQVAFHPHKTSVTALGFTPDGRLVSVGYRDGAVHLHDPRSGVGTFLAPPSDLGGAGAVVLPDNSVAVAFTRSEVACWDLDSGEELWRMRCPGELMGIVAAPDGKRLAVDAVDGCHLIDAVIVEGDWGPPALSNFAFGPDGTLFAYDSNFRAVVAENPRTGEWKETGLEFGEPEEDDCYALCCSPTGKLLVSGGNDGRVRIGDLEKGSWVHLIEYPAMLVSSLDFTPDGRTLASAHSGTVLFHEPPTARRTGALTLPIGAHVTSLAFSPDGETLAVGDDHGVVRLWPWRRLLDLGG